MPTIVQMNLMQNADAHDGKSDDAFIPLTAEQASVFRQGNPTISPWWVVAGQSLVGILVALIVWLVSGRSELGWSATYGALSVVLPAAVFARGLTSRVSSINPSAAVIGFFVWEMVKIGLTVAMLFAAPRVVPDLSWPAMLVGLIVTMKVYWLALAFRKKSPTPVKS